MFSKKQTFKYYYYFIVINIEYIGGGLIES